MKTKFLLILSIAGVMTACDLRKNDTAQYTLDSLRTVMAANEKMTQSMVEIGVLLDSIDAGRKVIRIHLIEGDSYKSHVARLRDINEYVRKAERKITALNKTVKKSSDKVYASALRKLKADLELRNNELAALTDQLNRYKSENKELITAVSLQKAEIQEKLNLIKSQQEETAQLQLQVNQLLTQSKQDQGDAYFARALAVEEAANRTKFAPKKKKKSQKEALELYKLALAHGKLEAEANIAALEKKL